MAALVAGCVIIHCIVNFSPSLLSSLQNVMLHVQLTHRNATRATPLAAREGVIMKATRRSLHNLGTSQPLTKYPALPLPRYHCSENSMQRALYVVFTWFHAPMLPQSVTVFAILLLLMHTGKRTHDFMLATGLLIYEAQLKPGA
jgi:hypothetical protein